MGEHKIHKPADYTSEDPILLIGPLSSNFSNVFSITFPKKKNYPHKMVPQFVVDILNYPH